MPAAAGSGVVVDYRSAAYAAACRPDAELAGRWVHVRVPGAFDVELRPPVRTGAAWQLDVTHVTHRQRQVGVTKDVGSVAPTLPTKDHG